MGNLDLKGGQLSAGSVSAPGWSSAQPVPKAKANEWLRTWTPSSATTLAMSINSVSYSPLEFPDAAALIAIAVKVTAAGTLGTGGTYNRIRLGIYNDDATGNLNPGAVLLDAGTIDATSTTWDTTHNILTIAQTLPAPGLYWLAAVWQADGTSPGAPTVQAITSGSVIQLPTASATPYSQGGPTGWQQTGVSGALPTPAAPQNRNGLNTVPMVLVQHG